MIRRILAALIVVATVTFPMVAIAAIPADVAGQLGAAGTGSGNATASTRIETIIARVISATFGLVGVTMLAFMVWAGYLWMTAAGEEAQLEHAQKIMRNATIGLIIVILSYAASRFVISRLVAASG